MKICIKCNINKTRSNDSSYCKGCHNEYQKAYYKKNPLSINKSSKRRKKETRDLIKEVKNVACFDCGVKYPYYVMDFDHVKGDKKFNLAVAGSKFRSLKTIKEEIAKCEVVCSNCHRERTFSRLKIRE